MKILNSKDSAIDGRQWSNPGAKFYDKICSSEAALREAYLVVGDIGKDVPFARSGCKYPHHSLNGNGDLVLNVAGVKAAYQRAKQMGIFKGDVKAHLVRHYKELGIYKDSNMEKDIRINENFSSIEKVLGIDAESYMVESVDESSIEELEAWIDNVAHNGFMESSHGNLKYCYRIGFDADTGEEVAVEFELDPDKITSVSSKEVFKDAGEGEFDQSAATDYVKKNIKKLGHVDFVTDKLPVHAIFTKSGNALNSVVLVPLFSKPVIDQLNVSAMMTNIGNTKDLVDSDVFKQNIVARCKGYDLKNSLEKYSVGELGGENKYKTTKLMWDRDLMLSYKFSPILRGFNKMGHGNKDAAKFVTMNSLNKFKESDTLVDIMESMVGIDCLWGQYTYTVYGESFKDYTYDIQNPPIENIYLDNVLGNDTLSVVTSYIESYKDAVDMEWINEKANAQSVCYRNNYMDIPDDEFFERCVNSYIKEYVENGWVDEYNEASHGSLKYCYRIGFDKNTGEQVAVEFELDPSKITTPNRDIDKTTMGKVMEGEPESKIKSALDKTADILKKTIRKTGYIDFTTGDLPVHAIFTRYGHRSLKSVKLVPFFSNEVNGEDGIMARLINDEKTYMDIMVPATSNSTKMHEYFSNMYDFICDAVMNSDIFKKEIKKLMAPVERYTVGKLGGADTYKTTKLIWQNGMFMSHMITPAIRGKIDYGPLMGSSKSRLYDIRRKQARVFANRNGIVRPKDLKEYVVENASCMGVDGLSTDMSYDDILKSLYEECINSASPFGYGFNVFEYRRISKIQNLINFIESDADAHLVLKDTDVMNESFISELDDFGLVPNLMTPEGLLNMMDKIEYDKSIEDWRLKSPSETWKKKKGNCHDQSLFEKEWFSKLDYENDQLFFIEINEGNPVGGNTHTLSWYKDNGDYYWFEHSWENYRGIHGPYKSIDDLKKAVYAAWEKDNDINSHKYERIEFFDKPNYRVGMTLGEYVDSWTQDDIMKESVDEFDEASHGKLKYDFRFGWDYKTGHMIKVIYSLDDIDITDIGDFYYSNYSTKDKHMNYVKNNISKKGNVDHQSKGQKVLAIVDMVTNQKLDSVTLLNPYCDHIDTHKTTQDMDDLKAAREYADKKNPSSKVFIKKGEVDTTPSFKSTWFSKTINDRKDPENLRFAQLSKAEMFKNGRGWKLNNLTPRHAYIYGDDGPFITFKNPNKQQALRELYLREKDILNYIRRIKSKENWESDPKEVKSYNAEMHNLRIVQNDISALEGGKYDPEMMKKYRDPVTGNITGLESYQEDDIFESTNMDNYIEDQWFITSSDGVENCCVKVEGYDHPMRGRSSMITLRKSDNVFRSEWEVLCRPNKDNDYGVPGGGWNKGETPQDAAMRELNEEASATVDHVRRMGTLIEYRDDKDKVADWVKRHVPEKDWWYGYYSAIFVGIYSGEFKGTVSEYDREEGFKWIPVASVEDKFPKEYVEAIRDYIGDTNTEFNEKSHGGLNYSFRMGIDRNTGHLVKIVFDLKPEDVTGFGSHDMTNEIPEDQWDDLQKNIRKTGHNDFTSVATVKAIVDLDTNKRLKEVDAVGAMSGLQNFGKKSLKEREAAIADGAYLGGAKHYVVGEKEPVKRFQTSGSYKTTTPAKSIDQLEKIVNPHLHKESVDDIMDMFIEADENNEEQTAEETPTTDEPPALDETPTEEPTEETPQEEPTEEPPSLDEEPAEEQPAEQPQEETPAPPKEEPKKPLSMPKQTDAAEKGKNGVNRKKLYIAFIEWCKEYNAKNTFGSVFDKDIFHNVYPFVPEEMRYFYRLANPILCVLGGELTFFQVSELRLINKKNKKMDEMMIFAATAKDLRVFNRKDKQIYRATEENGEIVLGDVLGTTFDLYIQNMIKKGDILNAPLDEEKEGEEDAV